ncbi:6-phosphogluconate dehydrogenase, NAD(+)-dependent, decarboxylating [Georgfuchsia toluolica]|uniref:6-phosphogluconate dehydrogenase, NAD(+)-dependent, decarboxylating n=1 Tax=Georgfuchsia toluolica TaxID=424218 RepID=A0A916J1Q7_9PROT|nr:decarboxylating 6-phosphogluconate dehydrogenase [Georgfuchsia toluolica]CAG4882358.1 6-phosphogluconate dehydrogenase, NAD(+)-dependent, decarboxylating [Georgfuchsia toluolica]
MQLGMIGLGRMGASLVRRLTKDGHHCVVYDVIPAAVKKVAGRGVRGSASIDELIAKLAKPRAVWVMVPAGVAGKTIEKLAACMDAGDIIIDGGNSYYRDDVLRAKTLKKSGIHYVDCGTSGGVFGLERGYCLMIGGEKRIVKHLDPIFRSIAPGVTVAPRTPGKQGTPSPAEHGYLHCGPTGAGHFVKMVHNGIEYGLMAAYAEGLNILRNANAGKRGRETDAETAPLRDAEYYQYDLDLPQITEVWRRGSVIGSWLLDLTASSLLNDPRLEDYAGRVSDSGEGRWTIAAALDEAVPVPVLSAALYERFSSRDGADFANRVLSAMRKQFGGHDEKKKGER